MSNIEKQAPKVREHLAKERTFLVGMRTCIGIMAFGFVVVKFALFVKQIAMMLGKENLIHSTGYSVVGIILVFVAAVYSNTIFH
jgi:putative membrane protein